MPRPRRPRLRKGERLGPRLEPPIAAAARLAFAYRAAINGWEAAALKIADAWERNPVAFGPQPRADASGWIKGKLSNLREEVEASMRTLAPQINLVAQRVSKKSNDFFFRALPRIDLRQAVPHHLVDGFRATNVAKIESLSEAQLEDIGGMLEIAEAEGWRVETLRKKIQHQFDVTRSKADLLARDQVLKLNAAITQTRQTQAGITQYVWSTSKDERVRGNPNGKWPEGMHWDLDGTVQDWNDPPVTNDQGDRNHPGEDYQCRCTALPIMPALEEAED